MAVEGMHSLKLSESKFKNWIKAGLSVLFTKEGIEPFVNHEIQQFQQKCLSDICNNNGLPVGTTCSSCCTENVVACPTNRKCNEGRGKCNFHRHSAIKFQPSGCPNKICDNFKKEIQNAHRFCGPSFINTTATQWCSNPWEVAKCFMSPDGYKDVTSAAETNFHGISSVIINNKAFESKIHDDLWKKNNIFVKAREIGNAVRESSYLQVEDRDLQQYFSTLQNLLSDPGYLADNTASQNANKKLSQLQQNILVIEINDIRKVLNDADKIVQDELRTIKDKHKKETEKQMLDLIVITNKFVSDFERQGKVSMSELDNAIKRAINETIQSSAKKELQIKVKEEAFIRKDTECLQRIEKEFDYGTERDSFKTVHAKRKRKEENTNVEVKRPKNEPSQKFQPLETCEKVTKTASNTINHREEVRNSGTDANAGIENIAPETETATKQLKVVDVKEADFGVENIVSYPNKVLPQRGETLVTAKEEDKTDIDIIPSDVDLHNIAQAIGQNWELLGPNFGLSKTRIDRIKIDCHGSLTRIFQMLHIWRQDQGPEGTIRNLFSVFRNQQSACIDWDALSRIFRNIEGCRPVIATEDNERYLRHLWFLGDGGLLVLKGVLTREEKRCGQSLENKISVNRASFQNMLEEELFKLFPSPLTVNGDVKTLDMSLLITVVKKLFWASLSPAEQSSVQTLKTYSNNIQGNPTNMSMGTIDFDTNWRIVGAALQQLASGISPPAANEIAELKKRAVSGTFDIKWILQHIKEMQAFKPSLLDALENKFRKSENLDLGSKLNDIKGNIDTMEKRNQKRHWEVSNSLNELHTTAKSSKQDITEIKDIAERSKNLHENDRDTIRHIAGVLDEHTNRTKHIEEMLEKITGKSPGKENQHDIETVMLIDSDTPENTSEAQQTIMATASDILDKLKGTEANIVEDKDVIEAILQNVKDLRNRELAEALLEYIKEYLKHGSILQIKEGSIRLTIRLKSYKGLLNLIQFLNSESLQRHLNDIGRALEMRNGHAVTISSHIAHESLHNLYKHLVEECEKLELTRKVILPVKCKNIEGLSNIWNLIQKGGANRHMERISDILTKKIGDKITVTTVVNVKQFEQTLLEIDKGSRNDMDNYADLLKAMSTLALDDDKTEKSTDESESGIMASDDLENHLYKNWVRGAKSLEYLQEGLQDFVGNKVQHCRNQTLQKIINSLPTGSTRQCNLCTSQNLLPEHAKKKKACNRSTCIEKFPNNCFGSKPNCRRKCPNGICSKFYDEIVLEHSSRDPLWKNTDPSTWCSDPLGWSFGKCFQTTTGPGSSASKTDAGGLLCILINNLTVQNNWLASNDMLKETCPFNRARVIRNAILHSSKLELDDLTLGYYLDTFITVLQDEKCLINCNGSKQAVHKLLQLQNHHINIRQKDEMRLIRNRKEALSELEESAAEELRKIDDKTASAISIFKKDVEYRTEKALSDIEQAITTALSDMEEEQRRAGQDFKDNTKAAFSEFEQAMKMSAHDVKESTKNALSEFAKAKKGAKQDVKESTKYVLSQLEDAKKGTEEDVKKSTKDALSELEEEMKTDAKDVEESKNRALTELEEAKKWAEQYIKERTKDALSELEKTKKWVEQDVKESKYRSLSELEEARKEVALDVKESTKDGLSELEEAKKETKQDIKERTKDTLSELEEAKKGAEQDVKERTKDALSELEEARKRSVLVKERTIGALSEFKETKKKAEQDVKVSTKDALSELEEAKKRAVQDVKERTKYILSEFEEAKKGTEQDVKESTKDALSELEEEMKTAAKDVEESKNRALSEFEEARQEVALDIKESTKDVLSELEEGKKRAKQGVKENTNDALSELEEAKKGAEQDVKGSRKDAFSVLKETMKRVAQDLEEIKNRALSELEEARQEVALDVKKSTKDVLSKLIEEAERI